MTQPNPDLSVNLQRLAAWNTAARRRQSFRSLQDIHRRGLSFRAPAVLPLAMARRPALAMTPALERLMGAPSFCAIVIAQEDRILFEHHAPDFATDQLHSLQSITKTFAHLALARLIEGGRIDPARPVGEYVPESGDAYVRASVQQVLDMDVASNFAEDYDAPYAPCPQRGTPVGYARQEIAMGWRLPPDGEPEFGVRGFAAGLVAAPRGDDSTTRYTSPNTDMLGWIIERASGRSLASHVDEIVAEAGLEATFHISADCEGVPVLSGGGVMTARDLARYGLLIARRGGAFMRDAMSGAGTRYGVSPTLRYRNHLMSNGTWVGHPGYAGQFLMVDPAKKASAAFFSVLETEYGEREGYFAEVISGLEAVLRRLD
ncbi:MAG: serine hydrolase domain-containing protein [Aestuariivirga sp.]|uniref:serine hydrolase domain-containing protein n=1 Tax=Aestuariivirga sp. TaxID=2650926 RepID=UPI003018E8F6